MKTLFVLLFLGGFVNGGVLEKQRNYPTSRILGGHEAKEHEAPYVVSLQFFRYPFCTGTLIQRNIVLTTVSCTALPISVLTVVAGIHDINEGSSEQVNMGAFFIRHSDYDGEGGPYDIAIIGLARYFILTPEIQLIPLPEDNFIHSGMATLYGWHNLELPTDDRMGTKLEKADLPIMDYDKCKIAVKRAGRSLHPTNICTSPLPAGISPCQEDTGSPLVQKNSNGIVELVGIVSWGHDQCGADNFPTVYTRISAHLEWIENNSLA